MPFWRKEEEKEEKTPFDPVKGELVDKFVTDELRTKSEYSYKQSTRQGLYLISNPREMNMILDFTGLRGSGSGIYFSLIYQLPKWDFAVKKVDEFIEVTPTWAEYYNITIAQKQKLEGAIKAGMASVAQAVADYELMSHDARRYNEILDYFRAAKSDEHVLRSLFVDRVDAFTGEGYSLVTMARRWPTIITDFIRMKEEWKDIDTIRKSLDVSQAEGTVLKTKNELFKEWKTYVLPSIKERYARIQALCNARRKSIDEYKNWLKPYISTYRMIRERQEAEPSKLFQNAYYTPGFGQSQAFTGVRIWAFKTFHPAETHRAEAEKVTEEYKKGKWELKDFREENGENKIKAVKKSGWLVFPYDDFVDEWRVKIEKHYGVKITVADINSVLKDMSKTAAGTPYQSDNTNKLYWALFDINVTLSLVKTPPPAGFETDNLMIDPISTYVMSQNVLLIHLLELKAREKVFEKYIEEILGTRSKEREIWTGMEEEFSGKTEEKEGSAAKTKTAFRKAGGKVYNFFDWLSYYFVKRGSYEPNPWERCSKQYNRSVGPNYTLITDLLMDKMQVE